MSSEITARADALRVWLEQRLGVAVAVVESGKPYEGAAIVITHSYYSDMYSGGPYVDVLEFRGAELSVRFEMWVHDLSGQCDRWELDVRGAREDDMASLGDIFHPRHRSGHWGNHATVEYMFNGRKVAFAG